VPTVTSVRAFYPIHDSSDKAILDSSIGAALETREESSHGGHGGHGGCLKTGNQWFCCRLWVLSALAWGEMNAKSRNSQQSRTSPSSRTIFKIWRRQLAGNENKVPVLIRVTGSCYRSIGKWGAKAPTTPRTEVRIERAQQRRVIFYFLPRCLSWSRMTAPTMMQPLIICWK
jgi:hypothetical protein